MRFPSRRLFLPALAVATAVGCHSTKKKCDTCAPPPPPPGATYATPPPGAQVGLPPGGTLLPPAAPPPGVPAAPAPTFPSGASYPPAASYYGSPGVRLGVPDSVAQAPQSQAPETKAPAQAPIQTPAPNPMPAGPAQAIRLLPPEFGSGSAPANPPVTAPPAATPTMPVGIVDFAPALPDRVAGGRKPSLDGLDWLKANGYKSAVLIRRPGESDAADRKQIEARGLTFQSVEVSPATLSWKTIEEFGRLVSDSATQPLFVYDADGSLAGGLWYLYFRRVEKLPDETARLRATRLGLKETDGSYREMWLAVQKLLAQS